MAPQHINWAIYNSLPPEQAQYQLTHIHESRKASTAAAYTICLLMGCIAIIMRFVSRRIGRTPYGADDYVMVAAYILAIGFATPALLGTFKYGGGQHFILMTQNDPIEASRVLFAAELFYAPAIGAAKISTLLLFARIFPDRKFRRVLWAIGIFVLTYTAIVMITGIFQCRPIEGAWNPTLGAHCIEIKSVWMVISSMNVLTDVAILFAPIPQLWHLQIRRNTKIELIGIFSIGGFVTIVSIYRIIKLRSFSVLDAGWSYGEASIWSIVEVCVAIVCASTITYRPLFNWIFRIRSSSSEPAARVSKPSATRPLHPDSLLIGSTSGKDGDVMMEAFSPASSPETPRVSGNGDESYQIENSLDM